MSGRNGGIEELAMDLTAAGIVFEREYQFASPRKWRADFRIGDLLVEVEGGTWAARTTRHTSRAGYRNDCEKYNAATLHGYRLLRFTADMVRDGALDVIERAVNGGQMCSRKLSEETCKEAGVHPWYWCVACKQDGERYAAALAKLGATR